MISAGAAMNCSAAASPFQTRRRILRIASRFKLSQVSRKGSTARHPDVWLPHQLDWTLVTPLLLLARHGIMVFREFSVDFSRYLIH
jgi:hypothetical protein